jgi:hypothetical protein
MSGVCRQTSQSAERHPHAKAPHQRAGAGASGIPGSDCCRGVRRCGWRHRHSGSRTGRGRGRVGHVGGQRIAHQGITHRDQTGRHYPGPPGRHVRRCALHLPSRRDGRRRRPAAGGRRGPPTLAALSPGRGRCMHLRRPGGAGRAGRHQPLPGEPTQHRSARHRRPGTTSWPMGGEVLVSCELRRIRRGPGATRSRTAWRT